MSDAIDAPRSRRAVLAGSIGAAAALLVQAIGRPVAADQGDPLLAGQVVTGATDTTGVTTSSGNGLQGYTSDMGASGVYGENTSSSGYGVAGRSGLYAIYGEGIDAGIGLFGVSGASVGVYGRSTSAYGVVAESVGAAMALDVRGRAQFSTSGLTSVSAGAKSKRITPGSDISYGSRILCTLESDQSGLFIQRVAKNVTNDTFTVYLSEKVATGKHAQVAWFLIG